MLSERYLKIYAAAIRNADISEFDPPLTKEEKEQFESDKKWCEEMRAQAEKEGRYITFEIPFD